MAEGFQKTEEVKYSIDEVIKMGTEIGIQTGMEYIRKEKELRRKGRHDRRLRNTKLLLREYRKLCIHSRDAVYSLKQLPSVIDILDELDGFEYNDDLYIESIKQSKERTAVIVSHIQKMMSIYRYMCLKSKKPEEKRRYQVIYRMYIGSVEATADELAADFHVDNRTIYKDIDRAIETLSALVFGIDGIKIF